jgi:hypothetical protein
MAAGEIAVQEVDGRRKELDFVAHWDPYALSKAIVLLQ